MMKTPATSRTLKLGALGLAAAAVISGSIACALRSDSSSGEPHAADKTAAASTAAAAGASGESLRLDRAKAPGLRHVYRVRYEQDLALLAQRGAEGPAASGGMKLRLAGELAMAFVGRVEGQHRLFAELSGVTLDLGAGADVAKTQELVRELSRPFYVVTDPDGRVRGYEIDRSLSHTARNVLRSVIGGSQFAARDDVASALGEDDIQGSYTASYTRAADGSTKKTKGKYTKVATMTALVGSNDSAATETGGQSVARLGADGWLTELTVDETGTASLGPQMPTATTRVHIELALTSSKSDPSLLGRFEREGGSLVRVGPFGTGDEGEAQRAADTRLAGDRTLDDLVSRVRAHGDDAERGALGMQLSARLRLTPGDAQRAIALAKTLPERDGQWLVGSLGGAGTEASVGALGAIANAREVSIAVRAQATTQLAFAGEHAAAARQPLISALGDGSREVRDSAALALGNVARELGDDAVAVGELTDRYRNASSDDERATLLRALGNSGSPDVLAIAKEAMGSASEALREAAVQSVRFMPTGEADALIGSTLASDPSDDVRQAAVDAIGFRLIELHARSLDRAMDSDGSGRVRSEIVAVIQRALAKRGSSLANDMRAMLAAVAKKAPPPEALQPTP